MLGVGLVVEEVWAVVMLSPCHSLELDIERSGVAVAAVVANVEEEHGCYVVGSAGNAVGRVFAVVDVVVREEVESSGCSEVVE